MALNLGEMLYGPQDLQGKVRLNTYFRILRNDQDHVLFTHFGQRKVLKFTGQASKAATLLQFLETPRDLEELQQFLEREKQTELGFQLLQHLKEMNALWIGESAEPPQPGDDTFFEHFTANPSQRREFLNRLRQTEICFISSFDLPTGFFDQENWKTVRQTRTLDFTLRPNMIPVIVCNNEDRAFLDALHRQLQEQKRWALVVQLDEFGGFVGPIVGGAGQPCLHCLDQRERSSQTKQSFIRPEKSRFHGGLWPSHFWKSLEGALQGELRKITIRYVTSETLLGRLVFDFLNNRTSFEAVYPVPGCWACQETRADA